MKRNFILALDQGTTGSRAFLFDQTGKIHASDYREFRQYFPKPGWVEHDADEIWQSCVAVIKGALKKGKVRAEQIAAIGITNQRETTILWDRRTGKPVARAIVWQCRRTADMCERLRTKGYEKLFKKKTGLVLDAYFSGTKIKWLLEHIPGLSHRARKGDICFGTIDSWLVYKLTGGKEHVTDMTNASRTLLFNIRNLKWDAQLLRILQIPSNILPRVQNSGSFFGKTVSVAGLPDGIPITAILGDQQAALYGQGCFEAGTVKNTYGTGCFLVLNTGKKLVYSRSGLLSTLASDDQGKPVYAVEGSIFIAGAVVQWLRDQLRFFKQSSETQAKIRGLKDTGGVYFVPAFTGLGAPYWDSNARGVITGLTRGSSSAHIIRAALESIAYQTKDVFDLMQQDLGRNILELKVDGGACRNDFLMQFQADILNCKIVRPQVIESTALGAAQLAGVTAGIWNKKDLEKIRRVEKVFASRINSNQRAILYNGWQKAVRQARTA